MWECKLQIGRLNMTDTPLASRLEGKKIGKWTVLKKREKVPEDNSGFFSTCYTVQNENGELAFLKGYNYVYAFGSRGNSAGILKFMTENFTYEKDLLEFCTECQMRRVVTAIDSGEYDEDGELIPVPYLVFEIAQGSLKNHQELQNPDLAWKLKAYHGALVGLSQLHQQRIAHQDIKPSNILIFGDNVSKISDLGSATQFGNESNFAGPDHQGDLRYVPIELLYGYFSSEWDIRRFAADLYMMGGLLTYLITGSNFLSLMCQKIPTQHSHKNRGCTYAGALPYIYNAYFDTLREIEAILPVKIKKELIEIIAELSHPEPEVRGNPRGLRIVHRQFSLERYISVIDRLYQLIKWDRNA